MGDINLPCLREKDGKDWWCVNDHTGCIYNDGCNTCMAEGDHPSPIEQEEKTD